jgi:arginyl-tRNA synthetase
MHRRYVLEMIRKELKSILQRLYPDEEIAINPVPKDKPGDYSTNLAYRIASKERISPYEAAQAIATKISNPMIENITVHQPGFINFAIKPEYILKQLFEQELKPKIGENKKYLIEYVSANPTGPINIVSARAAAVGDALVRMLKATGFKAYSEYYVNDAGRQSTLLAESVQQRIEEIRGKSAHIPDDGYHGEYLKAVAREAAKQEISGIDQLREFALTYFINEHKKTLAEFGVVFDNWVRESSLHKKGEVNVVLQHLEKDNLLYEKDGATWLKTSRYGDDDDRVLVTSDKRYTYLLSDIAYHRDKIERGFDQLINIWGPDHIYQIKSLRSGIQSVGYHGDKLKVIIIQQVSLKKDGKIMKMSKRAGVLETLNDLLAHVPRDVVRFFLLMRSNSQHLEFDLDLAQQQSDENPVYYVQYAHARIKSIERNAFEKGIKNTESVDRSLINTPEDIDLAKAVCRFPEVLEDAVQHQEPYMIAYYLIELAKMFHYFYQKQRVICDDAKLTRARLAIINKTAEVIKQGLNILGVSCPESM